MVIATVLEFGPTLTVALALAVVALEFLIAPFLLDLTLLRLFRFDWVDPDSVDPKMAAFLRELCQAHRIPVPRFGVIADARPNAFTYGHFPSTARLVITQGIVDMLDEEERKAVLAHEIGHIVHWDFVVMTVAAAIPVVLYALYRTLLRASDRARRNGTYLWMVAIGAYLAYLIAHFLVLLLSRVREYYADEFSALTTRNPNALATALAKIAYGFGGASRRRRRKECPHEDGNGACPRHL
jgi:Zn-dependent protease with chaperone function